MGAVVSGSAIDMVEVVGFDIERLKGHTTLLRLLCHYRAVRLLLQVPPDPFSRPSLVTSQKFGKPHKA